MVYPSSHSFISLYRYTVGCDDLGAPTVTHLQMRNRRGEHCSPGNRIICRCAGAHCAPLRDSVYQSLDAVRRVGAPYGIPLQ